MRLLIIEDDRESADYLVKAFREVGHVADLATDGEEGLALAENGDYDVLVVDRMLPKRDGLSLIGSLRDKGNRTPVLILSALGQVDDRIKGLRAGGDDYLPKPYSFGKLIRTTAFRLTLVYLFLFALFVASLLGYFAWNTRRLITEQITSTVNAETGEISEIFGRRGLRGLVFTLENRALRPGSNLYLVTAPAGQALAGNVG